MKIFITGSAGFVGFSLAKHLLEKGHEIHSIDNIIRASQQIDFNLVMDLRWKYSIWVSVR